MALLKKITSKDIDDVINLIKKTNSGSIPEKSDIARLAREIQLLLTSLSDVSVKDYNIQDLI